MFKTGDRVRFTDKVTPDKFAASPEEWASNPKMGTVMEPTFKAAGVFVRMDKEWLYNEGDLTCWLQGEFEIMNPDEIELIR